MAFASMNNGSSTSVDVNGVPAIPSASVHQEKEFQWYFTAEQLANSPSRRHGIDANVELSYRQLTAYLIQEMGQRLQVSQLCINTAIVYMHRFYAFHSFTNFHRNGIAAASLFLAAKAEEQPRKLEHVIKVSHICASTDPPPHPSTEAYAEQAQDLAFNENVLLQTLGFDVAIDHPHTHVVKTCHLVKACKDLAQTSYFLASNSLHLTTMCLQYRPTVVACFCIYLACKWSRWEIPQSTEGKHWFHYVDKTVTIDLLKQLTDEFIAIYEKSPARLKSKLNSIKELAQRARSSESNGASGSATSLQIDQQQQLQLQQQTQSSRRTESSHPNYHRTHHSSSHHHSKQVPPPNDAAEHKSASGTGNHKPPYPATSRHRSTDPNQPYPSSSSGHRNKQMPQSSSSSTSTSSSRQGGSISSRPLSNPLNLPPPTNGSTSQRPPHAHDANYHKNRSNIPPQLNPPVQGHKVVPKPDPNPNMSRSSSSISGLKDAVGRPLDFNKIHLGKQHFPNTTAANVGVDMTRTMLQQSSTQQAPNTQEQQRPFISQPASSASHQLPPPYSQPAPQKSSSSSSSNIKYDQQSVQQKQAAIESSLLPSHQQQQQSSNSRQGEDSHSKSMQNEQMELCSPPKYSQYAQPGFAPQQPSQAMPSQQQATFKSVSSIFSPEYSEKPAASLGYDNTRADKRQGLPPQPQPPQQQQQQQLLGKKPEQLQQQQQMKNYTAKRPLNSDGSVRPEDEAQREVKMRKVAAAQQFNAYSGNVNAETNKNFPSTTAGIETNPDLVSCLLKESLGEPKFAPTGFIKSEMTASPPDAVPTVDVNSRQVVHTNQSNVIREEQVSSVPVEGDDYSKGKAEKKKKKDKHKHKEKGKSKDKEERKKHKKDKDKHKERDRASEAESEPVKIKISMPQHDESGAHPPMGGFKIKIPKDRLTGYQEDASAKAKIGAPPALKIKISKDKIESYNQNRMDSLAVNALPNSYQNYSGTNANMSAGSNSSSGSN